MPRRKNQQSISVNFYDSYHEQPLEFKLLPIEKLEVISHQRKPSSYHIKHLINSIERIGFIVPIVVTFANNENWIIIDGQHRFLAAKELGIRELPAIIVPPKLAQLMMNLNIEKELNIREKSYVAVAIYREYLNSNPDIIESDPEIIDSIEQAYYITLGIAYEKQEKLAGSSFEPILKKCDFFLDEKLIFALEIRNQRADKIIETNYLIREIVQKLRNMNKWHPYIYQQIISYANPYKKKRLPTDFDDLFVNIIENLKKLINRPELILKENIQIEEF